MPGCVRVYLVFFVLKVMKSFHVTPPPPPPFTTTFCIPFLRSWGLVPHSGLPLWCALTRRPGFLYCLDKVECDILPWCFMNAVPCCIQLQFSPLPANFVVTCQGLTVISLLAVWNSFVPKCEPPRLNMQITITREMEHGWSHRTQE
jgi:hypothetical protein